jgi:uncharacterized protein (TIGR02145 family)
VKSFHITVFAVVLFSFFVKSQTVTGTLITHDGIGVPNVKVQLYAGTNNYSTITTYDGSFVFNDVTSIKEGELPSGYNISNNYPNPFNPKTRIEITLPKMSNVKVEVFNITGQRVGSTIEKYYDAGIHAVELEMNGLSNGVYFVRFSIDDNYTAIRKVMLLYGSNHLNTTSNSLITPVGKVNSSVELDSIVVTGTILPTQVFTSLPQLIGNTVDVGNLTVNLFGERCPGLPTVEYEGKIYNTVLIRNQCWLKENLNIGVMINSTNSGFQQTNNGIIEKYCYNNNAANCNTYGGLYEWPEAMQYLTTPGARGICPEGWNIPTYTELQILASAVGNNGNALKAIGQGTGSGMGTNTSGFSALLSGTRNYNGNLGYLGYYTNFWSSTEYNAANASNLSLDYSYSIINFGYSYKEYGFSVRCLKDFEQQPSAPTLSSPANNATNISIPATLRWNASSGAASYTLQVSADSGFTSYVYNQSGLTATSQQVSSLNNNTTYYWLVSATNSFGTSGWSSVRNFTTAAGDTTGQPCPGTPTVSYAGKTYNTVLIGSQCWLKENLNVGTRINGGQNQTNNNVLEKYCYNNDTLNCITYGGLYQWDEAMQYSITAGVRGICPEGWHIPTYAELQTLASAVGNNSNALKAIGQGTGAGAGTNTSGFSALLSGCRVYGNFGYLGLNTIFGSSTEYSATNAVYLTLGYDTSNIFFSSYSKEYGFSVRCLKD